MCYFLNLMIWKCGDGSIVVFGLFSGKEVKNEGLGWILVGRFLSAQVFVEVDEVQKSSGQNNEMHHDRGSLNEQLIHQQKPGA